MQFYGYQRSDGTVGVRNYVLILPTSICASDTARIVASQVRGAIAFHNENGCSQVAPDQQLTMDVIAGYAANPNVYGVVAISLGCENCQMDLVLQAIRARTQKPVKHFMIQQEGGTLKTVEQAVRAARDMVEQAGLEKRVPCPLSGLVVATECGGSDPTSGIASNRLVGLLSDFLVDEGATAILSETTEMIGAEHILAGRAKNEEIRNRIFEIVRRYEHVLSLFGEEVRKGNPSPGNIAGGITTLEEKSLGCIHKAGHRMINAVYDYAKMVSEKGLVIMDTPGNDPSSVAGMVAGGAQIVVFTTGRGTPTGNPLAPVIKITGNRFTYQKMQDNIDIDASPMLYGTNTQEKLFKQLLDFFIQTAEGKRTKAETLGYVEMAVARACNYV